MAAADAAPHIQALGPVKAELKAGQDYYFCTCGRSTTGLCQGLHKGTPFSPKKFTVEKDGSYYLCQCKQSGKQFFCDGSHGKPDALKAYNKQLLQANSSLTKEVEELRKKVASLEAK